MESIIEKFYFAFQNLDAEEMVSYYHEEVIFEDPAFGKLRGDHARNMWRMLCKSQKGKDFKVTYDKVSIQDNNGKAHWEANYIFSQTGRKIHNKIDAEFTLKDGKIIKHTDHFNLHQWATQALGFKGWLIGWTPFFKNKLQSQTNRLLTKFETSLK